MEYTTTKFEPAEITFNQETKAMDEIISALNKCKETTIQEGLFIDWHYLSFQQLIDDKQLSLDIVMRIMEINPPPKGTQEIKSINFKVEKNDFFYSKRAINSVLKKLVEGYVA